MRKGQAEKALLAKALADAESIIREEFDRRFVRISYMPGDTFFHVVIEGDNGRRYLEVAVKERI